MLRAVLFDWFSTLAHFNPPRYELYCQAFRGFGIEIPQEKAIRGTLLGDECVYAENLRWPLAQRTPEERFKVYLCFPRLILQEAGISAPQDTVVKVRDQIRQTFKATTFTLFDDAVATLKMLKQRDLITGVITNMRSDISAICRGLGLEDYLDFAITSEEAGATKPSPLIFTAALKRARLDAGEAIYVGDQYQLDVAGARAAGIQPVLLDRCNLYPRITDCPRIRSLTELASYLPRYSPISAAR
jgi:putative hydrolase of the HAD superfamily